MMKIMKKIGGILLLSLALVIAGAAQPQDAYFAQELQQKPPEKPKEGDKPKDPPRDDKKDKPKRPDR